ncbi:MAG: Carbohydrate-binding CenC domain protein [Bacteroidetes bacterium]|jgi:hypothetical protein|nr:Carbohydrate-binding CenC domain protein [Bacteroidota bacterium]
MRLLRLTDYIKQIQSDNLNQIVEGNYNTLLDVEQAAQAEMISYLAQRYDVSKVFTDTTEFDITSTYSIDNLVEYTAPTFNSSSTYSTNDKVVYSGSVYSSVSGSTGVLPSTGTTSWSYVTTDKSLYYAISATTGNYPDDTAYWVKGDNRNQQIVMYMVDITLYHLHSRINPRQIPEVRMIRYDGANAFQSGGAIGWLKKVASGDVTAALPTITPEQGVSIRWGSITRNTNNY